MGIQDLEGLHESPEQDPDGVALSQQLDEPGGPEETQKADVDEVFLLGRIKKKKTVLNRGGRNAVTLRKLTSYGKLDHESVHDAPDDGDEVERVPAVHEVALVVEKRTSLLDNCCDTSDFFRLMQHLHQCRRTSLKVEQQRLSCLKILRETEECKCERGLSAYWSMQNVRTHAQIML